MPVSRAKLVLAYDGTGYRGSQIQPGVPTIQDELEKALHTVRAFSARTTFAGRTDAGVHAMGQVVSVDVDWSLSLDRLRGSLNAVLPGDIRVLSIERAAPSFSARFDAVSREYRYRVVLGAPTPSMLGRYAWSLSRAIEPDAARAAAAVFRGSHSFGSFASAGNSQSLSACELRRNVLVCEWRDVKDGLFSAAGVPAVNELRIAASGFLPQMVRNIVAAIIEVASGKESLEWLEYLLVSGDRRLLGAPAPPHGLSLWRVSYGSETNAVQTSEVGGWD